MRTCGTCSLCCKLLPVKALLKGAGERCQHQRAGKGCTIYPNRPPECQLWSCQWLMQPEDTADLKRPDRVHYVIDPFADYVTVDHHGEKINLPVAQVWVDPSYPDAHRDPALRTYLAKLGEKGMATLVRFNSRDGLTLMPPAMTENNQWLEAQSNSSMKEHTVAERHEVLNDLAAHNA